MIHASDFRRIALCVCAALWVSSATAEVAEPAADPMAVLTIAEPTANPAFFTRQPMLDLAGGVKGLSGIARVEVQPDQGPAIRVRLQRVATGDTADWRARGVRLLPGVNRFQIRLVHRDGQVTRRYLSVWRGAADAPAQNAGAIEGVVPFGNRMLPYVRQQGRAIVEGDIDVGSIAQAQAASRALVQPDGLGQATATGLWPSVAGVVQIPYIVTSGNADVPTAISQFNAVFSGVMQWVPRVAEVDYVDFNLDPGNFGGSAFSKVGRYGGPQQIGGSILANVGTLLHEMGHAVGLLHEQSRADRDAYITINDANVIKTLKPNFDISRDNFQSFGLYDYASAMHYQAFTFSKNGEPTIESIPAGIPISEAGTYSAGDIDAILRQYGLTPNLVTITSNPPGLQVIVNGATLTTPQTFNFPLESVQTLNVPTAAQTLTSRNYIYGRWGDNRERSHPITIARGNGAPGSPTNRPAVTVYTAHFLEVVPYAPFVYPAGAGSIATTPLPQAYPPLAGLHFIKGRPVALQTSAASGNKLYRLYTADGPVGVTSKTTRYPDWVLAYFTPQQRTTIGSDPIRRWLYVDGQFWEGPVNFSPFYPADGDWSVGASHTIDVGPTVQLPYSYSIRYPFQSWSDSGAALHGIVVPSGNATFTATFGQQFYAASWAQQPCAGAVSVSPFSGDGFYDSGTNVSFTQTAVSPWLFTGWQQDFIGKTNPKTLAMTDERLMVANYNAINSPVTVTSLTPSSRVAGQGNFSLKIAGTGFTSNSGVFIGGVYRAAQSISAKSIKVNLTAADTAVPGGLQVFVQTAPPGNWNCAAYDVRSLMVRSSNTQALAEPSPAKLTFASQTVGTMSAPQPITFSNAGNTPLALHDAVLSGANAADFILSHTCGTAVGTGAQCTATVWFQPTASGKRTANLLFVDTALNSPQAVTLSGTGAP